MDQGGANEDKLTKLFGVSRKIKKLLHKQVKQTPEELAIFLLAQKEERQARLGSLAANHRFVLEIVADCLALDNDELIAGIIDDNDYVDLISSLFNEQGVSICMISYQTLEVPTTSGRYNDKLKGAQIQRAICIPSEDAYLNGKWICAFRNNSLKAIENKNVPEEVGIFMLSNNDPDSPIMFIKDLMGKVLTPSLESVTEFGLCSVKQKLGFMNGLNMFNKFLQASSETVETFVHFEVSHTLYKGLLLAKHQIEESSIEIERVRLVEKYFATWLRQIQAILIEGQRIQRDASDAGPLEYLIMWRRMLAKCASITEFTSSKPFQNHEQCLKLSRSSKLLKKWVAIDEHVTLGLNEAKDNVKYISFLQKYWEPLYKSTPDEIITSLPGLMVAIRNVSKTAQIFHTASNATALFLKITNQLTIASRKYLNEGGKKCIWDIPAKKMLQNIFKCNHVMIFFKALFKQIVEDMKAADERPWKSSQVYIFTNIEKFLNRLEKIQFILDTELTYSILDNIKIMGMEKFNTQIKSARDTISQKNYDPLDYRIEIFDVDFKAFMKDLENAEIGMQKLVKEKIQGIPIYDSVILVLKRFERLNLECLCMDRRYLDVAEMLEREILQLKDSYNMERDDPDIPKCMPPAYGRIIWMRCILKKMNGAMDVSFFIILLQTFVDLTRAKVSFYTSNTGKYRCTLKWTCTTFKDFRHFF